MAASSRRSRSVISYSAVAGPVSRRMRARHGGLTIINVLCLVVSPQDSVRRRRASIAGVTIYCAVCVMSGDTRRR